MFVQVIQGKVTDAEKFKAAGQKWVEELSPGATGYLGSTSGVTEDGTAILVARFESAGAARRNSDRPEQGEWWAEMSKLFVGDAVFKDSEDTVEDIVGDPDTAGFVQVMQGTVRDPAPFREMAGQGSAEWAAFRPDILGSLAIFHDGGGYTMVIYFTNEEEARAGEKKDMPPEMAAQMEAMNANEIGVPTFFDLRDPVFSGPS